MCTAGAALLAKRGLSGAALKPGIQSQVAYQSVNSGMMSQRTALSGKKDPIMAASMFVGSYFLGLVGHQIWLKSHGKPVDMPYKHQ